MTWDRRALLAAAVSAAATPAVADAAPKRIVSLNACLDAILVQVADRRQIVALSHYARQPQGSTIADVARTLPFTWETAEEVIALEPDLVLASRHSAPATRNALNRLKVRTERFGVPKDVAESVEQVRTVAALVGRPQRGEALVARIEAALAAARPPAGARRQTALVFQSNGFSAGADTLIDEMLSVAGFDNKAREWGFKGWGNVPLEKLIADPPQVLLVGEASPGARSWGDRVMTHPALRHLEGRMRQARLPERVMFCGGPVLIESAGAMARAFRDARGSRA